MTSRTISWLVVGVAASMSWPGNLGGADNNGDPVDELIEDQCDGKARIPHKVKIIWPIEGGLSGQARDTINGDIGWFFYILGPDAESWWHYAMSGETKLGFCEIGTFRPPT